MVGYSEAHVKETRERILYEAGRLMRKNGYAGVSIGAIMKAANLTHGGFYAHFKSKEDLFVAMIGEQFDFTKQLLNLQNIDTLEGQNHALMAATYYLDPANSDKVAPACTLASSTQDVARAGSEAKSAFTKAFQTLATTFENASPQTPTPQTRENALATLSTCVGGLILAQAINDESLNAEILNACQKRVEDILKHNEVA